jgi:hypothetical protein
VSGRCGEREKERERRFLHELIFIFDFVFHYCSRELNTLLHQEVEKDPSALSFVRPTLDPGSQSSPPLLSYEMILLFFCVAQRF